MSGRITIAGIGPGSELMMTPQVREALSTADAVVGYTGYLRRIGQLIPATAERFSTGMTREVERAEDAFVLAAEGRNVVVVSSGDAGIYGMAPLVLEMHASGRWPEVDIVVLPGISAFQAAAARLGAPLSHDFCTISLSDLLTSWAVIETRITAAAAADFVTAVYNPRSRDRYWQIHRFRELFLRHRSPSTPVGIVRNVSQQDESVMVGTLGEFDPDSLDMFSIMLVGNTTTFFSGSRMITPRGYFQRGSAPAATPAGQSIMSESFRTIAGMMHACRYPVDVRWAIMHTIHTTADFEMQELFYASPGAISRWHDALTSGGAEIVTDVTMVQSGLRKAALQQYGVSVHCYLHDPRIPELARSEGITRSQAGMRLAAKEHPEALFVIGNAPTALLELAALLHAGGFSPMGIVGAPVGFVHVVESKHRLKAAAGAVPIAMIEGRKGGSAIAATIVNAAFSLDEAEAMNPGCHV